MEAVAPIGVDLNVYLSSWLIILFWSTNSQFLFVSSIVRVLVRTLKSTKKIIKYTHTHTYNNDEMNPMLVINPSWENFSTT